ncbi:MAG: hypothetical protein PHY34_03035 [Patescibacteria group bacterium]|nr:hypothetical protein [Patescibacteria group bacterium]MDD5715434.1 hypothetical protein [Patescibacteria group bacterium]
MQIGGEKMSKRTLTLLGVLGVLIIAGGYMVYNSYFKNAGPNPAVAPIVVDDAGSGQTLTFDVDDQIFKDPQYYSLSKVPFSGFTNQLEGIKLDSTKPLQPLNVTVTDTKVGSQLVITWELPKYINFNALRIYRAVGDEKTAHPIYYQELTSPVPGAVMSFRDEWHDQASDVPLKNGQQYSYIVRTALSSEAGESESSNKEPTSGVPTDRIAPDAPLNVTVQSTERGILVSWLPPQNSDFALVRIYRSEQQGVVGSLIWPKKAEDYVPTATSYLDTVDSNTPYFYTVTSVDTSNNESSRNILATPYRLNPFQPAF